MADTPATDAPFGGRLGRTSRLSVLVTSASGALFPATVYEVVNVTQSPELGARIDDGSLWQVASPDEPQRVYTLAQPVIFHDEERRIFALVLPEGLRHRELQERARLLERLAEGGEPLPTYVRGFATVFGADGLQRLLAAEPTGSSSAAGDGAGDTADSAEVARAREALAVERSQLDEVRERLDREREQMDAKRAELVLEERLLEQARAEVDTARLALEAERLRAEEQALRAASGEAPASEEATQVVTDDQFLEILSDDEDESLAADGGTDGALPIDDELDIIEVSEAIIDEVLEAELDAGPASELDDAPPASTQLRALTEGVPRNWTNVAGQPERDAAIKILDGEILAARRLDRARIEAMLDGSRDFFVQLHEVDGYPLVALTLARLGDDGQPLDSIGWALDVADDAHRVLLDALCERVHLRLGLYRDDGQLMRALEVDAPLAANLRWIREQAEQGLQAAAEAGSEFGEATETFAAEGFERVGSMRHSFARDSFSELGDASAVALAAGIVGYWSQPEVFTYLIANRSFPLDDFRAIQERVVRGAVDYGVHLEEPLRDLAVELDLASDEPALVELLLANFAEVCLGIRANGLDPLAEWENWDALLTLGDHIGVAPDPDVVDLADLSLKRAQEFQEIAESSEAQIETLDPEATTGEEAGDETRVEPTSVVSKRSESTGVTYFLPEDAVLDQFDDLVEMERDDLELLLADANGRLEASQMLLERFGSDALDAVLVAVETMSLPELTAIARFLESKADALEGELVRALEGAGPSGVFVLARALTHIKSTGAIPTLLDALLDPQRHGDLDALAEIVSHYGERLLPALTRAIKRDGATRPLVVLLACLEDRVEGTLGELSKDRSKNLREAARQARQRRGPRSA